MQQKYKAICKQVVNHYLLLQIQQLEQEKLSVEEAMKELGEVSMLCYQVRNKTVVERNRSNCTTGTRTKINLSPPPSPVFHPPLPYIMKEWYLPGSPSLPPSRKATLKKKLQYVLFLFFFGTGSPKSDCSTGN